MLKLVEQPSTLFKARLVDHAASSEVEDRVLHRMPAQRYGRAQEGIEWAYTAELSQAYSASFKQQHACTTAICLQPSNAKWSGAPRGEVARNASADARRQLAEDVLVGCVEAKVC